jgi:hypothetical protein
MYQIAKLAHYYKPDIQGDEQPRVYTELYDTIDEAQAVIAEWDEDVYITDHNESGRPTYVIVEDAVADYIANGRHQDMSNYNWDNAECTCGECTTCSAMMIGQDRDYLLTNALYKS